MSASLRQNVARPRAADQLDLEIRQPHEKHEALYREHRAQHPAVYRRLREMAFEAKAAGWKKIGIRLLWERMRWEFGPHARDRYGFSMNDWLTRFYARELLSEPGLEGFFETRERAS